MARAGAFPDHDSCLAGLAKAYPDKAVRAKACKAAAGVRPRKESQPRREGVRVTGTTMPGGPDGHVHDFTAELYEPQYPGPDGDPQKAKVMFWCSPAYVPGQASLSTWEPGQPQTLTVSHWHEWSDTGRTAEAAGHDHELPDMPDVIAEDLDRVERMEDHAPAQAQLRVEDGDAFWLVRGLVSARAGVSKGQRLLKRRAVVEATAQLLDGAAIVYGHPAGEAADGGPIIDVDHRSAPGVAVNARMEDGAATYDALLWKENPEGYAVSDEDLARSRVFVDAAKRGEAIHNSLGTHSLEVARRGEAEPMGGGDPVPYDSEQVGVEGVGHVAILSPVIPVRASCPPTACGLPPVKAPAAASVEHVAEALGVRREAVLVAAAMARRTQG